MSLHGNVRTAPTPGPPIPNLKGARSPPACTFDYASTNRLHPGGEILQEPFSFAASASAWRAEQAGQMNASEGLKSTAASAPSSPMRFMLRSIVVRLLFCFKASASAWPGRSGRPHECKRGPQEHGSLGTIITDAIAAEVNRGEAAVQLQSLCECLPGWAGRPHEWGLKSTAALALSSPMRFLLRSIVVRLLFCFKASASAWPGWAGRPHECKRGPQEHGSLGTTIITDKIRAEVNLGEAAVLLQSLCQCLAGRAGRPHECKRGSQEHSSLGTIITDAIPVELDRSEAAVLL